MSELITVNYDSEQPTVLGRDLHEALGINTPYRSWFPRMCEYGFTDGVDYTPYKFVHPQNKQEVTDHQITIPMAKEICMIQRSEKGKMCRQYFISIEEQWNTPEAVMARALQIANRRLDELKSTNLILENENALQKQQIAELQPKASYYDVVLNCKDAISATAIAKDYGKSAQWLNNTLHNKGIQFRQGAMWLLYQKYAEKGYTNTKTQTYPGKDGTVHSKVHTYWTQKGRLFIYEVLKADGVLPVMEREQ